MVGKLTKVRFTSSLPAESGFFMKKKCKDNPFREEDFNKKWKSGGFGDGTLIRHCKLCGYFEVMLQKENQWKYGGTNWS